MSDKFINHLMTCKKCYGVTARYCDEGRALKIDCDADYFAGELAKIPQKEKRAAFMVLYAKNYFNRPALDAAIKEKFIALRQQAKGEAA